ncbi:PIN domain-containing protein [Desulfotignum phosphitoxidans]|jgi:predicted nucleic acid-binding protein|uniref:PIN domain-containing protein n=1 Tax=Desulfotignum phosphitoxidans DSM 13687 TaxID=1286635 RepID=S0FXY2_9BACT|nr:PIN domain-containing protein [Desulfotignum phosphitoxidans DSM 13687]
MLKVVVDTNVFISSFFGGIPRQITDCWKKGKITLCFSQQIIEEYIDIDIMFPSAFVKTWIQK